jgi:hypothetical protein
LIGASLPITGFIIWWGKRKKKPKKPGMVAAKHIAKKMAVVEESIT